MSKENYIQLSTLCTHYQVEMSLFTDLTETGLLTIEYIEELPCISEEFILDAEKMIRLHQDLEINAAGIETIFHLLNRMDNLHNQLQNLKYKLSIYED